MKEGDGLPGLKQAADCAHQRDDYRGHKTDQQGWGSFWQPTGDEVTQCDEQCGNHRIDGEVVKSICSGLYDQQHAEQADNDCDIAPPAHCLAQKQGGSQRDA